MYSEGIKAARRTLTDLHKNLPNGSILFPFSKAYEEAVFIGNVLYHWNSPAAVVQAVNEDDIKATIKFAKDHGIQLSVQCGGHSNAGFCLNKGSNVLDIHYLNKIQIFPDIQEMSVGASALWRDVYKKLHDTNNRRLMVVGGQCPTIGVAGFSLGDGISPFSRSYGLGINNILELTIIIADGSLVTLNKELLDKDKTEEGQKKRDLFWALHGGRGGNFGVVTFV